MITKIFTGFESMTKNEYFNWILLYGNKELEDTDDNQDDNINMNVEEDDQDEENKPLAGLQNMMDDTNVEMEDAGDDDVNGVRVKNDIGI
jgi:hypothetical protein